MTPKEQNELYAAIGGGCATIAFMLVMLLLTLLLTGCSKKVAQPTIVEHELTITNTRTEYVHDTLYVDVPAQTAVAVVLDSASVLENDFATSTARINPDGTLFHTLATKPQSVPVERDLPVVYKDSISYKETRVPYPVEKQLTKWQQIKVDYYDWLLAVLAFAICCMFRKPLLAFARRFI